MSHRRDLYDRSGQLKALGQVVIELVIAVIATMIFFVGTLSFWGWMTNAMVQRQRAFESTRASAATPSGGEPEKARRFNYEPPRLAIWGSE